MTLRERLLALLGATALLGLSLLSVASQPDGQAHISVTITGGGPLLAYLSNAGETYSTPVDPDGLASGTLTLRVLDTRGLVTGWRVWLTTWDFVGGAGHIGTDQLTISAGSVSILRGNPDLTGHTIEGTDAAGGMDDVRWSSAPNFGDGEYDLPLSGTLMLPGGTWSDAYTYTVIVNVGGFAP